MKEKTKSRILFSLHFLIILSTLIAVGSYFFHAKHDPGSVNEQCFRYFTTDSNILVGITTLILLVLDGKKLKDPAYEMPKAAVVMQFVSTVSVVLTMMTVLLFLGPIRLFHNGWKGFLDFYSENLIILHLTTPVLALISWCMLERSVRVSFRDCLWALVPTVVYSLVYLVMVVVLQTWPDFYGFTFGGNLLFGLISLVVMYAATLLISMFLRKMREAGIL